MASYRKVFFSFKWSDVTRAEVVRNSYLTKGGQQAARYIDKAQREAVKKQTDLAIKRWINKQMRGTTVTVVLVGEDTCRSRWVRYEIEHTIEEGNGLLEIDISKIKDLNRQTSNCCGRMVPNEYPHYLWFRGNGYENLGDWVERAAREAGY